MYTALKTIKLDFYSKHCKNSIHCTFCEKANHLAHDNMKHHKTN